MLLLHFALDFNKTKEYIIRGDLDTNEAVYQSYVIVNALGQIF